MIRNKIIALFIAVLALCGCDDRLTVKFDTPFVAIADEAGTSTSMIVDKDANNLVVELDVYLCASNNWFKEEVNVEYELIVGDGLKEGVDFKVQPTTASPLIFQVGEYHKPIRVVWFRNAAFDPDKDNTLTVRLSGCSIPNTVLGYPGPNKKRSQFIFTKK